jgi:hypothetical protein
MAGDDVDKRTADRLGILGELRGEVMVFQPMTIREISRGGVQVETAVALHVNSLHELRLTLGSRSVVVRGRVAHCSISDVDQEQVIYRAGLEFIEPSEHVEGVIVSFVEEVLEARGGVSPAAEEEPRRGV